MYHSLEGNIGNTVAHSVIIARMENIMIPATLKKELYDLDFLTVGKFVCMWC